MAYKEVLFGPPGVYYEPSRSFKERAYKKKLTYYDVRSEDDETRSFDPGFTDLMKESIEKVREMANRYRSYFMSCQGFWPNDVPGKPPQSKGQESGLGKYEKYDDDKVNFTPVENFCDGDLRVLVAAYRWLLKKHKDPSHVGNVNLAGFKGSAEKQHPFYTRVHKNTGIPVTPLPRTPPPGDSENETADTFSDTSQSTLSALSASKRRDSLSASKAAATETWARQQITMDASIQSQDSGNLSSLNNSLGHPTNFGNQLGGAGALESAQFWEMMREIQNSLKKTNETTERLEKKIDDNRAQVAQDIENMKDQINRNSRPNSPRTRSPVRNNGLNVPDGMQDVINVMPSNARFESSRNDPTRSASVYNYSGRGRGSFGRGRGSHMNSIPQPGLRPSEASTQPSGSPPAENRARAGAKNYRNAKGRQHYRMSFEYDGEFKRPVAINGPTMEGRKCRTCNEYGHESRWCPTKKCFDCGRTGHFRRDCPKKYDTQEQYHNRMAASARVFRKEEVDNETYHEAVGNVYKKLESDYGHLDKLNFDQIIDTFDEYTTNIEYDFKDKFRQWQAIQKKAERVSNHHTHDKRHSVFIHNILEMDMMNAVGTINVKDIPERDESFTMKIINFMSRDTGMNVDYIRDTIRCTEITEIPPANQNDQLKFNIEVIFHDVGAVTRILDLVKMKKEQYPDAVMTGTYKEGLTTAGLRNDNAVKRAVDELNEKEAMDARLYGQTVKDPWVAVGPPGIMKRVRKQQAEGRLAGNLRSPDQDWDEEGDQGRGPGQQQRRNQKKRHWTSPQKGASRFPAPPSKKPAPENHVSIASQAEAAATTGGSNSTQGRA